MTFTCRSSAIDFPASHTAVTRILWLQRLVVPTPMMPKPSFGRARRRETLNMLRSTAMEGGTPARSSLYQPSHTRDPPPRCIKKRRCDLQNTAFDTSMRQYRPRDCSDNITRQQRLIKADIFIRLEKRCEVDLLSLRDAGCL